MIRRMADVIPHRIDDAVPLDQLEAHPANANRGDVGAIHSSIDALGFYGVVIAQAKTNRILAGHHRIEAARQSGIDAVPVMFLDVDDAQALAILVGDNRHARLGTWDEDALIATLQTIASDAADLMPVTGFDGDDLDALIRDAGDAGGVGGGEPRDPAMPDKAQSKWKVETGDVWLLGEHRLVCGDSRDADVIALALDGRQADAVWTDPPYGVDHAGGSKDPRSDDHRSGDVIENDDLTSEQLESFLREAFGVALAAAAPGAAVYAAAPPGPLLRPFVAVLDDAKVLRQCLVWAKDQFVFGRSDYHYQHEMILYGWKPGAAHTWTGDRKQSSVLNFPRPHNSDEHPTMKPVALIAYCIENSTHVGATILDPFAGSASTLIAAHETGRVGVGVEISPRFVAASLERFVQLGIEPVRA